MSSVYSGAWYLGAAYLLALAALITLVVILVRQHLRRPRIYWRLDGVAVPLGEGARAGIRADLRLTNAGNGPAFGVETLRSAGVGTPPVRVAETSVLGPGEWVRIVLELPDERAWRSCWIRPICRPSHRRFDSSRRRFAKIEVAKELDRGAGQDPGRDLGALGL
ncbi:MAG: hypothetical protein LKI24_07820 [Acidipropionibacterium sp.]|jgi:hypothetical protein|nr:hypothetical protein [Acidipropionibacterium sp.]